MTTHQAIPAAALLAVLAMIGCAQSRKSTELRAVASPPTAGTEALYVSNRAPLLPSPFVKLPIGSITPKGWLHQQLILEKNGMSGRLPEISKWCNFQGNAWADSQGAGHSGWEEMPYWLKGFGDLGYVLKDPQIIDLAKRWIDAILATQREDGWFGPRELLTSLDGKPDLWPNMLALNILQSYYEYSPDPRILPFMTKYFRWQANFPEKDFMVGYWPHLRAGDNIESIYWLYNRTGEPWLLDVAAKVHRTMARWDNDIASWHGVNLTQGFRAPAVYYMQAKDPKFLLAALRNYNKAIDTYGQFPGGMFVADENARPGYTDPRGGAETCSIVEFMHSFEMLTKITGDATWSDRCEDVAFNSFPAALTPDWSGLHYVTSANQVQLDKNNKAPGIQNGGNMFSYSPFEVYRCCQHNVAHGWPYFAEELWLATSDKGLAASLYAPSQVTAKVADGSSITISEETEYPFSDTLKFTITKLDKPQTFPLYFRIPAWCKAYELNVNNQIIGCVATKAPFYAVIDRQWQTGDIVQLKLPMTITTKTWPKQNNAVSVNYGPLTFALKIGEKWTRYGNNPKWPEFEVFPTTPWNYGLVADSKFELQRKPGPLAAQPFTPDAAPIQILAKARKIPLWKQDATGLITPLQPSPIKSAESVETVTLIPMGCARLRISAFPTVSDASNAREWALPPKAPSASHCNPSDTTLALYDGKLPKSSTDADIPRFTWWDHKGSAEWVQYDFEKPKTIKAVEVYWFDDTGKGSCRVPKSWRILYKAGNDWKPVANPSPFEIALDKFNRTTFDPIETRFIRLEVQLQGDFSGGILEWRLIE